MWYNDVSLLRGFGQALATAEALTDSEEFVAFMSKPQKYDDAFASWADCGYPTDESDDGWDDFVTSLGDDEEE